MAGIAQIEAEEIIALSHVKKAEIQAADEKHSSSSINGEHEPDGIHDGLEFPTEEEKDQVRWTPNQGAALFEHSATYRMCT